MDDLMHLIPGADSGSSDGIYNIFATKCSLIDIISKSDDPDKIDVQLKFEDENNRKKVIFFKGQYGINKKGKEFPWTGVERLNKVLSHLGLTTTEIQSLRIKGYTKQVVDFLIKKLRTNEVMVASFIDTKGNNQQWDVVFPSDSDYKAVKSTVKAHWERTSTKTLTYGKNKGKCVPDPYTFCGVTDSKFEVESDNDFDPLAGGMEEDEPFETAELEQL
jgi:hypothetical protein